MPLGAYAYWCVPMGTNDACPQGVKLGHEIDALAPFVIPPIAAEVVAVAAARLSTCAILRRAEACLPWDSDTEHFYGRYRCNGRAAELREFETRASTAAPTH
jgi:hypothetical protein